ncbi:outer membrane efflux protein [Flammeovirgaceae bacterium 311]|nr:outer membrane efflux protein [Flammeovirgaceae bacterium 311]
MRLFSKSILLILAVLLAGTSVYAQEATKRVFSLQEAIAHAIENNVTVKNERLNEAIATAQVKETVAQGLPQINAAGNITHNAIIPITFLPANALNPGAPDGVFMPVPFGVPFQSNVSVSAEQLLFNGSYFIGLRAAKVYKELTLKNTVKAAIDVAEGVALAYYGALVAEERIALLDANVQRLDTLYAETRAMNENGFVELIDVQRIKVNLNNLRTELENVQRSYTLNLSALKYQMGLPNNADIELAEQIRNLEVDEPGLGLDSYQQRIEYQQLNINRDLANLDLRNTRMRYYPTLSLFGNFGYNAGKSKLGDLFQESPDFYLPMGGADVLIEAHTWNPFTAVGVNLNIPVFDGFLKANTIRRQRLITEQVDLQIKNLENAIDMEVQQAQVNLQNSLQSLETQQENMELAQEVYRVTKIKYQQGVGSNLEVVEAENALKTAETNYYQALYNALVSRVSYDKATGNLLK